jgi:CelD/BcsL family acetyltransferase involved in cellulose biosynthesis
VTVAIVIADTVPKAEALAPQWRQLPAAGASSIYTSPAWCLAAWRSFPDLGPPRLVAVRSGEMLLGVMPLTAGSNSLSWAGWPLGDEHDARVPTGSLVDEVAAALLYGAASVSLSGDTPELADVRADGVLTRAVASRPGCPAPILQLRDPDAEFGTLACVPGWSRDRRRGLRSARRRLAETGAVTFERVTEPDKLASALPVFVKARLAAWRHRNRLDELPTMDRHINFPNFLADVGRELGSSGQCYLAVLSLDGEPIAQSLLFRTAEADLLYMSTYRAEMGRYGPSHLLLSEIASAAVRDGRRIIELGRGDEPYKFDLGAEQRHLRDLLPQRISDAFHTHKLVRSLI